MREFQVRNAERGARAALVVASMWFLLPAASHAAGDLVLIPDLRMTLAGYPEPKAERGIVLSNWEI